MSNYIVNTIDKTNDAISELYNLIDPHPIIYRTLYEEITETRPVIRYFFMLTGAADGQDDVTMPITSFQCRYKHGEPTFLSVVIPYKDDYVSYINDRPNGELVVTMKLYRPGTQALIASAEIVRVDMENIRTDEGGNSKALTLEGHKTIGYENQTVTLTDCIYKMNNGGKLMFRFAAPHIYLRPNDTLVVGSDSITVGMISYFVGVSDGRIQQQMDVQEAD